MRLATLPYHDSTSVALVLDDGKIAFVRALNGRQDNYDVRSLIASPLGAAELRKLTPTATSLEGARFLPPLTPPKNVLCVGKNYVAHAIEGARAEGLKSAELPKAPIWFTKAHTCLIGSGDAIKPPRGFDASLDYEGELAVIIGRRSRNLTTENALHSIFGYTVFNDITARAVQQGRKQWFKGKSADTFGPIGPWVVTADDITDPQALHLVTKVNGEIRQEADTADMIFSVADLLVDLTQSITLEPGDIVSTGTPSGVAWGMDKPKYLANGDRVSVEISRVGVLENVVGSPG